jgi:hypothetical protein
VCHTRVIAGPKPFHRAATPSCAIVFRTQSKKPLYVPVGAAWILDFTTLNVVSRVQPAIVMRAYIWWDRQRPHRNTRRPASEDDRTEVELGGRGACWSECLLRNFVCREVTTGIRHSPDKQRSESDKRSTSWPVPSQRCRCPAIYTSDSAFLVEVANDVKHAFVLLFRAALSLNL